MKRKITIIVIIFLLLGLFLPTIQSHSGPELEVNVRTGMHFPAPSYKVRNIGDSPVHNVEITDTSVEGNILYNNRDAKVADVIELGELVICDSNSWFVGFGVFSIVVTITSDEGVFYSEETNGFIIGSVTFIP